MFTFLCRFTARFVQLSPLPQMVSQNTVVSRISNVSGYIVLRTIKWLSPSTGDTSDAQSQLRNGGVYMLLSFPEIFYRKCISKSNFERFSVLPKRLIMEFIATSQIVLREFLLDLSLRRISVYCGLLQIFCVRSSENITTFTYFIYHGFFLSMTMLETSSISCATATQNFKLQFSTSMS